MGSFDGKIAIVTGASRGIGRAVAIALAKEGATVIVNYNGCAEKAEQVVEEITKTGGKACCMQCDVSNFSACWSWIKQVKEKFNRIDILVNNAGMTKDGYLARMSEEDFSKVLDVNLKGTFNCMHLVTRQMMRQRKGRIVNMTSVVGIMGNAGQANYAAAKAGIIGLTQSAAKELGGYGITVNAVAPGLIETDMTNALPAEIKETMLKRISVQRVGQAREVAALVAFLASDEAAYINGQTIRVDGGML